jgi:hypothetical protein
LLESQRKISFTAETQRVWSSVAAAKHRGSTAKAPRAPRKTGTTETRSTQREIPAQKTRKQRIAVRIAQMGPQKGAEGAKSEENRSAHESPRCTRIKATATAYVSRRAAEPQRSPGGEETDLDRAFAAGGSVIFPDFHQA